MQNKEGVGSIGDRGSIVPDAEDVQTDVRPHQDQEVESKVTFKLPEPRGPSQRRSRPRKAQPAPALLRATGGSGGGEVTNNDLAHVCGRFPGLPFCGCTIPCRTAMAEVHPWLVIPRLYLGPVQAAYKKHELRSLGVTHILDLANSEYTKHEEWFTYLSIPIDDTPQSDILSIFASTNKFIDKAIVEDCSGSGGVLVHCNACISRSPTIVIAYLMWKQNLSLANALAKVQAARDCAKPNDGFMRQLREYECQLQGRKNQPTQNE
jgi:protein-tyrosine phosphatase